MSSHTSRLSRTGGEVNPLSLTHTVLNVNSSRFGKMLVLHFTDRGKLQKASILTYLLAKERVVQIPPGEFGFHIFYALCHAAADVAKSRSSSGSFCSSSTIRSGRERQEETEEEEERCRKEEKEIRDLLPQLHLKGGCLEAFQILSHPSAKQLKKDQDKNTKREELERKGKKNNEGEEEKEEERAHQQDEVTGKESPSHSHTRRENKREDSCPTPSTVTTPWRDLRHIIQSMGVMGIDARTRALVFKILAAILHLGNLSFRGGERARREDRRGLELREEEQEEEADGDGIRRKRRKVRSGAEKSQRDDTSREDHGGKRKEEEEGEEEEQSEQEKEEEEEKGDKKTKESDDCHKALELTEECKESLRAAAQLLGVCGGGEEGEEKLRLALVSRSVRETRSYLNREGALAARNATCKALYSRVFDCVVSKINASLAAGSKQELHRPRPLSSSFSSLSPSESSLLELSKGVKEKHQQTTHVESSFLPGNEEEENKRTEEEKKMKSLFCQKTKFSPFSRGTSRPSPPTSATSAEDFPCLQEKEKKRSGEGEEGSYSIGILDIFGFEDLASHSNSNRLEQLCINYANEKLHCFFLQQLLLNEKCLYIQEGLIHPLSFSSSSSSSFISTASSSVLFSPVKHVDRSPSSSPFSLSLHSLSSTSSLSQSSLSFLPSLSNKRHHLSSSFSRASLFSSSQGNESWRNGGDLLILRSAILCCLIGGVSSASHVSFLSEGLLDKSRQLLLPLDQSSSSSSSQERKEQSHYSRGGEERGGVAGERQAEESFYLQSYVSMKHLLHSLIQKKTPGLFQLLDEVSKLPLKQGGNRDVFFYQKLLTEMKNRGVDDLFIRPGGERKNHRQHHQQPRDLSSPSAGGLRFTVSHFACDVSYDVRDFCRSNSDILSDEIEQLFLSSSTYTELMRGGGEGEKEEEEDGNNRKLTPSSSPSSCGSLPPTSIRTWRLQKSSTGMSSCLVSQRKSSLSVNFASQLQLILKGLQQTSCHYIRCIKPNLQQRAGVFDEAYVLHQLKCSGLVDLLHVMAVGYACRVSYEDLWKRYEAYLPSTLRHTLTPRDFASLVLQALQLPPDSYRLGISRVFFRLGCLDTLDQLLLKSSSSSSSSSRIPPDASAISTDTHTPPSFNDDEKKKTKRNSDSFKNVSLSFSAEDEWAREQEEERVRSPTKTTPGDGRGPDARCLVEMEVHKEEETYSCRNEHFEMSRSEESSFSFSSSSSSPYIWSIITGVMKAYKLRKRRRVFLYILIGTRLKLSFAKKRASLLSRCCALYVLRFLRPRSVFSSFSRDFLASLKEMKVLRDRREEKKEKAMRKIQAAARSFLERRRQEICRRFLEEEKEFLLLSQLRMKREKALIRIQAVWRGYSWRCRLEKQHRAAVSIQRHWWGFRNRRGKTFFFFHLLKIQRAVRRWIARRTRSKEQEEERRRREGREERNMVAMEDEKEKEKTEQTSHGKILTKRPSMPKHKEEEEGEKKKKKEMRDRYVKEERSRQGQEDEEESEKSEKQGARGEMERNQQERDGTNIEKEREIEEELNYTRLPSLLKYSSSSSSHLPHSESLTSRHEFSHLSSPSTPPPSPGRLIRSTERDTDSTSFSLSIQQEEKEEDTSMNSPSTEFFSPTKSLTKQYLGAEHEGVHTPGSPFSSLERNGVKPWMKAKPMDVDLEREKEDEEEREEKDNRRRKEFFSRHEKKDRVSHEESMNGSRKPIVFFDSPLRRREREMKEEREKILLSARERMMDLSNNPAKTEEEKDRKEEERSTRDKESDRKREREEGEGQGEEKNELETFYAFFPPRCSPSSHSLVMQEEEEEEKRRKDLRRVISLSSSSSSSSAAGKDRRERDSSSEWISLSQPAMKTFEREEEEDEEEEEEDLLFFPCSSSSSQPSSALHVSPFLEKEKKKKKVEEQRRCGDRRDSPLLPHLSLPLSRCSASSSSISTGDLVSAAASQGRRRRNDAEGENKLTRIPKPSLGRRKAKSTHTHLNVFFKSSGPSSFSSSSSPASSFTSSLYRSKKDEEEKGRRDRTPFSPKTSVSLNVSGGRNLSGSVDSGSGSCSQMIYQKEHATCTKEKDMMRARREERRNIVRTPGGEEGVWIHLKDDNAFPATAASASPSSSVKSVGTCVSSPRELSSSSTTSSSKHRHLIESSLLKATPDPVSSSKIPHYTRHASFVKSSSSSFLSSSSACVPQSQPSTIRIVKTSSPSPSSSQERSSIAEGIRGGGEIARRRQHQPLSFSCKSQAGGVELSSMKLLPASEIPRKRSVLCASSPSSSSCLSSPSRGYPSSLIPLPSSSHAMNDAISPSSSMHVFPATCQSPLISVKTSSLRNESSPRSVSSSSLSAPASLLPSLSSSSSLRLHRSAPGGGVDGEPSSVYHDCRSPLDRTSRRQSRSREGFFRQQPHHRCHHEERSSVLSGQPRGPSVSRGEREKEEEEEKENERGKKRKLDSSIPRPGLHGGEDDTKTHEAYQREVPENLPYSIATREERSVPHPLDREDSQASIRSCIPPSEKKEEEMSATSKSVSHPKTLAWNVKKRDREEKRSSHGNRNANHPISGCFRDISRAKSPYSAGEQTFPPVSPPRLDKNDRGGGEEEDLLQSSSSPSFLSLPVSSSSMCSTTSDYGLTLPPSPELGGGEEEEADHEGREGRCDLLGDLSPPLIPTDFFYHEQEQQRDVSSPRETIETHRSSRQSVEQPTQGKKETFPTRDRLSCSPTQEPPSKKSEDDPSKMSSSVRRLERHSPLRSEETCCQVKRNGREEENRQFFLLHKKDGGERSVHHKDLKRDGDEKIKAKTKEQSSLLLHHSSSSHVNQEMTSSYHHLHHTSSSSSCCHTNSSTSSSSIPSPTLFIVSAKKRLRHQQSK